LRMTLDLFMSKSLICSSFFKVTLVVSGSAISVQSAVRVPSLQITLSSLIPASFRPPESLAIVPSVLLLRSISISATNDTYVAVSAGFRYTSLAPPSVELADSQQPVPSCDLLPSSNARSETRYVVKYRRFHLRLIP
jgi:hypothetical protein